MQPFPKLFPKHLPEHFCDVLIIGSGAAGLSLALRLAPHCQVMLLSKGMLNDSATYYAQGGIAAVVDETDTWQSHCHDTLIAGAGLCDPTCVEFVTSSARHCITWLIAQGMVFDSEQLPSEQRRFHLTREGGHSQRRVLHTADTTGRTVINTLLARARTQSTLRILENFSAIDLITTQQLGVAGTQRAVGAYLWHNQQQQVETAYAKVVVLATGGSASLYQHSTNPNSASGDGIAIAWRAGCRVANLEFNQFHPTTLYHPQAPNFLLTEALRGEGALLHRPDGSRFMPDFDPRAELAPRDIVARTMYQEMQRLAAPCLYLTISHQPARFVRHHFPTLYQTLLALGLDLTQQPIPVVPAAHYTCGGVMVDHEGRSDVAGLYAIGEVSYTGLHGANRLASNALLECLVYGCAAATPILQQLPHLTWIKPIPAWKRVVTQTHACDATALLLLHWQALRGLMWQAVGLIRTTEGLERALAQINQLKAEIDGYYAQTALSSTLLTLRNGVQVAQLMVRCALARLESRGVHYTLDYPQQLAEPTPTVLISTL